MAGAWHEITADTFAFVASSPFVPSTTETLTVPGGSGGVTSASGKHLSESSTATFTVATGSTLRLQQLLAQLGYLPVSFTPARPLSAPQEAAQAQEGSFSWRWTEPASLVSLWTVGTTNQITKGAVMAYESQHGMKTDGVAGPAVWQQLLGDAAAGTVDPSPYNYVYVSKSLPETTTVYSNGSAVYSTRANTGVAAAPTASGTFPVYVRYKVTTMSGTNPDGSKYVDPGIPWVSYFNGGDALHGFVRGRYGYPQSDGCVEMPPANAAVVYPVDAHRHPGHRVLNRNPARWPAVWCATGPDGPKGSRVGGAPGPRPVPRQRRDRESPASRGPGTRRTPGSWSPSTD